MSETDPAFRWRSVLLSALLPTVLFSIGQGAVLPIIPVVAKDAGATLALAGLVATMIVLGQVIGDIPSGVLIARIGERTAMLGAAGLAIAGLVVAFFARDPLVLGVGILIDGIATAVFALARHAFMTTYVPLQYRARALSSLGGTFRLGGLVGPFIGAGVIQLSGDPRNVFWVQIAGCLGAAIVLLALRDPGAAFERTAAVRPAARTEGEEFVASESRGLFATVRRHRRVLLSLGLGSMAVAAVRQARQVVLPLWAVSIGLHETQTSLII
ncbi:MAG TPA: MFS transporter, partial [Pseudolysinimonas sp.]